MIIEISSIDDPRLSPFAGLTEAQLRNSIEPDAGLFIAESPKVITTALDAGMEPMALLTEPRHITGDAAGIIARCGEKIPVYTGRRELLAAITGYTLTRGVLCAMRRPPMPSLADITDGARRIVVIDGVTDTTNIGAIFRASAALGVDAVVLDTKACDPLNRRAVRVSMGAVFLVPWTRVRFPVNELKTLGFTTVAMALRPEAVPLDEPSLPSIGKLAIIMGTEGDGLSDKVIDDADITVMIPMAHGVDSLNVASAAAVAIWQLRPSE